MDNPRIIHAPINIGRRYGITSPITQYDYGYLLLPEGVELPTTYEIDFSNDEKHGTSFTVYGNSEGAEVPEVLIRTGKDVFAFYYEVGEGYGKTEYTWRIPNHCRPDRDGGTPTPSQQSSIDQLIVRSNEAVESAEQSAEDASASAQNASADADRAEEARTDAQNYANNAQASATSASQSATASANSATASAQSASEAETARQATTSLVAEAQGYAQASAQSASASANSASQAQGYAQSASASASSAQGYASQADISANTASAKASEASTSASTASQKATESAQSASQALSYKTDAESAKTASQTAQGLAESARDSAVSAKTDAESARDDAVQAKEDAESAVASISGALAEKAPVITDTASGSIASFSDGADDLPLKSLIVDINPVQDLHGQDRPYPAGGGANKWDEQWETGWIGWSGQNADYPDRIRSKGFIPVSEGSVYRVVTSNNLQFFYYDSNKSFVSYELSSRADQSTITIPTGCAYIRFYTYGASYGGTYKHDIAINYPSTVTTYSPYSNLCPISGWTEVDVNHSGADMTNPTTLTINLGQTVYGGKLDVLSGELTIDMAMVDLGTLNWDKNNSLNLFYTNIPDAKYAASAKGRPSICSALASAYNATWAGWSNFPDYSIAVGNNYATGFYNTTVKVTEYTDVASFKQMLTDTNARLVYELATPLEIQLSANQVNSLLGVNNIWADSGDTTAEYRADTKLFIERLTAPDSVDMIADSNITSGQYFMVGNSLYKATANIANGSAIIVGTNCIRKSLSEALNEINA